MSELEEMLGQVLSDPEQMSQISRLAQSLLGSEAEAPAAAPEKSMLSALLGGGEEQRREQALLEAMKPWLSEKRQGKLDRAMKLAKMARLARRAMGEESDV